MLSILNRCSLYKLVFSLSVGILILGILNIPYPLHNNIDISDSYAIRANVINIPEIEYDTKNIITKDNIYAFSTCMIVFILFGVIAYTTIQDNIGSARLESKDKYINYNKIVTDRENYISAYEDAKQKASILIHSIFGRVREDYASIIENRELNFSSIIYNKIDFVEAREIKSVNVRDVIENIMSIMHFKMLEKNINFSFEDILDYEIKTDPILLEFLLLCIIQRIIEGLNINKKIHFKFNKTKEGYLELQIEDNGYELDFFDFKLNTLLEIDATSIKLLGYKLDSIISSTSTLNKNIKQIKFPLVLELDKQKKSINNVIDFASYKNKIS